MAGPGLNLAPLHRYQPMTSRGKKTRGQTVLPISNGKLSFIPVIRPICFRHPQYRRHDNRKTSDPLQRLGNPILLVAKLTSIGQVGQLSATTAPRQLTQRRNPLS